MVSTSSVTGCHVSRRQLDGTRTLYTGYLTFCLTPRPFERQPTPSLFPVELVPTVAAIKIDCVWLVYCISRLRGRFGGGV